MFVSLKKMSLGSPLFYYLLKAKILLGPANRYSWGTGSTYHKKELLP